MDKCEDYEEQIVMTLTPYLVAFPQSKMTAGSLVIYAKALRDLTLAEINAAMLKLMRTCRFFPTVAEIFEQAEIISDFAQGSRLPTPDEAWAEVQREVRKKHLYGGEWELSCPEVKRAVDYFGKLELCSLEIDDVNTARAQFMRIYKSIIDRAKDNKTNQEVMDALPQGQVTELIGKLANAKALPGSVSEAKT